MRMDSFLAVFCPRNDFEKQFGLIPYERAFRGTRGQYSFKPNKYIYTTPYLESNIGNVFIDVKSGLLLKIGHNLKEDDISTISPVLDLDNFSF